MGGDAKGTDGRRGPTAAVVALGVVIALMLILASLLVRGEALDARLEERKAELRAAGLPASVGDLVERRMADRSAVLAAEELLSCLVALGKVDSTALSVLGGRREFGVRRSDVVRAAVQAELLGIADEMARLRAGLPPVRGWPLHESKGLRYQQMRGPNGLLPTAGLLATSARVRAEVCDGAGAAQDLAALLMLADALGDEPLRIEHVAAARIDNCAVEAIEETLGLAGLPSEAVVLLRSLVERRPPSPEVCLAADRAWAFSALKEVPAAALPRIAVLGDLPVVEGRAARLRVRRRRTADALLLDQLVEAWLGACLPDLRARRLAAAELLARHGKAPEDRSRGDFPAFRLAEGTAGYLWSTVEHETALRVAATALALEQWRAAHEAWPESLEQLVPELLSEVPEDPYSEGKLIYRRTDDGVLVYSAGHDGGDEGRVRRGEPAGSRGHWLDLGWDLQFRLLDPERRGVVTLSFQGELPILTAHLERLGLDDEWLRELGLTEEDLEELR